MRHASGKGAGDHGGRGGRDAAGRFIHSESSRGDILTSGRGTSQRYLLARIKRDHPDIFAAVERGEYRSARAAAKAAGIIPEMTPLDYLHRYWRQVSPEDRLRFLSEMLTPNERRAL